MKALIAGCGIAGAVTAVALRRAGFEVTVAEAYPRSADGVGAFLSLPTNALAVLDALDLLPAVTAVAFATPGVVVHDRNGKQIGQISYGTPLRNGTVAQTIKRSDLYKVLRDACESAGAHVSYGKRLTALESTSDGTTAVFADGTSTTADVLIGADGLRSTTRTLLDPTAPAIRYTGLMETGGYARGFPTSTPPGVLQLTYGRGGLFCHIPHPNGDVWWFAQPPAPEPDRNAVVPKEQWRAALIEKHDGLAADIIAATDDLLSPWAAYDLPSVPTWHKATTVLIGDAAHAASPASGQGAAMALEDAITLARHLRDTPHIPTALANYTTTRRPRVERAVAQGKLNGDLGRVGALAAPMIFKSLTPAHFSWLTDHHETWQSA